MPAFITTNPRNPKFPNPEALGSTKKARIIAIIAKTRLKKVKILDHKICATVLVRTVCSPLTFPEAICSSTSDEVNPLSM